MHLKIGDFAYCAVSDFSGKKSVHTFHVIDIVKLKLGEKEYHGFLNGSRQSTVMYAGDLFEKIEEAQAACDEEAQAAWNEGAQAAWNEGAQAAWDEEYCPYRLT